MHILVSSVGTRGDVQPALDLGVELQTLGRDVRLCAPPNFVAQAQGLGFEGHPIGVEIRAPNSGQHGAVGGEHCPAFGAGQLQVGALDDGPGGRLEVGGAFAYLLGLFGDLFCGFDDRSLGWAGGRAAEPRVSAEARTTR